MSHAFIPIRDEEGSILTKPTVMLSLSGGIDSTHCLYNLLMEKKEVVLIHHMRLYNWCGRQSHEYRAVQNILAWLRIHRLNHFIYEETAFDYGTCRQLLLDAAVVVFSAMAAARQYSSIERYVRCGHIGDIEYQSNRGDVYGADNEKVREEIPKLILGRRLEPIRPNKEKTKQQVISELPKDLFKLTWYCRTPMRSSFGIPCGRCKTCKEVETALITLGREDEIKSAAYSIDKQFNK